MSSSRLMQVGRDAKRISTPFDVAMTRSAPSRKIASACHRRSGAFPAMGVITTQQYSPENDKKDASVPLKPRRAPRSTPPQIERAPGRERVCEYVEITVVA